MHRATVCELSLKLSAETSVSGGLSIFFGRAFENIKMFKVMYYVMRSNDVGNIVNSEK